VKHHATNRPLLLDDFFCDWGIIGGDSTLIFVANA